MSVRVPKTNPGGPRLLNKKDVTDMEAAGVKLRRQMDIHVTCLESRSSSKLELVQEWHEYVRKRSEIELEYAKSLDKLSDRTLEKINRLKKGTKEGINACSSSAIDLLHSVVTDNKTLSSRRVTLCDDINNEVLPRLDVVSKDINVATRRVREGFHVAHEEIKKAHSDLTEAMKAYMIACLASEDSQSKLSKIQSSRSKGKNVDKDAKKEIKMLEGMMTNKFKAINCRNEYVIALEWFNKVCRSYFGKWSGDLLEFFDFDFHSAIGNIQRLQGSLEKNVLVSHTQCINGLRKQLQDLSPKDDLVKFQTANAASFPVPAEVAFLPHNASEKNGLYAVSGVHEQMTAQRNALTLDLGKTTYKMDEAHKALLEVKDSFGKAQETLFGSSVDECIQSDARSSEKLKNRTHMTSALSSLLVARREHQDSLCSSFNKVLEYTVDLTKKYTMSDMYEEYLKELSDTDIKKNTQALATESLKCDDSAPAMSHLDKYMLENNNKIPPIVTSCIRFVEEHGPTVEGVFRVPGIVSQIEEMREKFIDEDIDPLCSKELTEKSYDIHAVGSLLKQYLRDLPEPVFPFSVFQRIVDVQTQSNRVEKVNHLCEIMKDLPECRLIVLSEIMRFLEDFSMHATATKMNKNNLALVFGPTLLAAPPEMDAVTLAQHTTSINLVTLLMVENRVEIFGEPEHIEPPEESDDETQSTSLSRVELRKLQPILYNQLEKSLMYALCPGGELPGSSEDITTGLHRALYSPRSGSIGGTDGILFPNSMTPEISLTPTGAMSSPMVSTATLVKRRSSLRNSEPPAAAVAAAAAAAASAASEGEEVKSGASSSVSASRPSSIMAGATHGVSINTSNAPCEAEPAASAPNEPEKKSSSISRFGRSQSTMAHNAAQNALSKALSAAEHSRKRSSVPALSIGHGSVEDENPGSPAGGGGSQMEARRALRQCYSQSEATSRSDDKGATKSGSNSSIGELKAAFEKMEKKSVQENSSPTMPRRLSSPTVAKSPPAMSPTKHDRPLSVADSPAEGSSATATVTATATAACSASPNSQPTTQQVKASHAYTARTAKELSFTKGAIIDVFSRSPDGNWWDSVIDGKRGYIPASYVKVVV